MAWTANQAIALNFTEFRRNTITRPIFKMFRKVLPRMSDTEKVALEAGDGRQAVTMAEELDPDVVLMDVVLPILTGIAATLAACPAIRTKFPFMRPKPTMDRFPGASGVSSTDSTDSFPCEAKPMVGKLSPSQ